MATVFELTYPGTWLDLPDKDQAFKLSTQLHMSEGHFVDAAVSFNLFVAERSRSAMMVSQRTSEPDSDPNQLPMQYQMRVIFIYGRSFVYALDNLGRALKVLSEEPGVPTGLAAQVDSFYDAFPSLVGVRDTAHHPEDRGRGLDKKKKPLNLQPINNGLISAPNGGVLVLDSLNGNRYTCTMADGHLGEVEVSEKSVIVAQDVLQNVLNAFKWRGPQRHVP